MNVAIEPVDISGLPSSGIIFTFCTLLTKRSEYELLFQSYVHCGFDSDDCEFLVIDNSVKNQCCGLVGINMFLNAARGEFVILCHQDVELIDSRKCLERSLNELTRIDPHWALAGNAGGVGKSARFPSLR